MEQFRRRLNHTQTGFIRSMAETIHWDTRLIGLRGPRGVGKTTLLLQHIKQHFPGSLERVLYASLDNLWFSTNSLLDLADTFFKQGGTHLFLDEVHGYPHWAQAIKNIYDDYPELNIVFTGSSLLKLLDARADLSRRAVMYAMQGLSFREYLAVRAGTAFPVYTLEELLGNHEEISRHIVSSIRPLAYFSEYLRSGYYPYFLESSDLYPLKLEETITMILEMELPQLRRVEPASIPRLRQLMGVITESAPFVPNISKLSERIGLNRQTLLSYLHYLEEAQLVRALYKKDKGISILQKPEKLYLDNTNLMYLFKGSTMDPGNARETFLANQLAHDQHLAYSDRGDFLLEGKHTIEVGGRSKTGKKLGTLKDAYIAADNLEYSNGRKIPLWLFGFLY